MKVTDGQTETLIALEPSARSDHVNGRRAEGKLPGEYQLAMVEAAVIRGVLRPTNLKINVTFDELNFEMFMPLFVTQYRRRLQHNFPFDVLKKLICWKQNDRRGK